MSKKGKKGNNTTNTQDWLDAWDKEHGYSKPEPYSAGGGTGGGTGGYVRCHTKHKEIAMLNGVVLGASCLQPREGYDIYVGLDGGMKRTPLSYPWNPAPAVSPVEIFFPITDMCAPGNAVEFNKMVAWLIGELEKGKRVHMGCIGGHGRTGILLSALVAKVFEEKDAIQWVRKNYCTKAVESTSQIKFLMKHYGVSEAAPSKGGGSTGTTQFKGKAQSEKLNTGKSSTNLKGAPSKNERVLKHIPIAGSIWG